MAGTSSSASLFTRVRLRLDVLVEPEDVVRVPCALQADKPVHLVRAVYLGRDLVASVGLLVDVAALECVPLGDGHCATDELFPLVVLGQLVPLALGRHVEQRMTTGESRRVVGDATHRAALR